MQQVFIKKYNPSFLGAIGSGMSPKQGVGERSSSNESLCFKGIVYTIPNILRDDTVKPSFTDTLGFF